MNQNFINFNFLPQYDVLISYEYEHASFYSTLQILHSFKNKGYGNFASSKSIGAIFPTAFAHFMSLFHILVILEMFQTFAFFVIFVELP